MRLTKSNNKQPSGNKWEAPSGSPAVALAKAGVWGAVVFVFLLFCFTTHAQDTTNRTTVPGVRVSARVDASQITVGDQVRLFIEAKNVPSAYHLTWPVYPDTFNHLEIVERGKIDTVKQGDGTLYKQRLIITGFDSGVFKIPPFPFSYISTQGGSAYIATSDSFNLLVQTVAVDTTKGFKGIKGIIYVKSSWRDYLLIILGGIVFLGLIAFVIIYFLRNKGTAVPKPQGPVESLQDYTLRILTTLDTKQLWQKKQVKQYYVELTDIVRDYIEQRFATSAKELTTEELLEKAHSHKELQPYYDLLSAILQMADLAKFAKFQALPQEHIDSMDKAKQFVDNSRPAPVVTSTAEPSPENKTPE